MDENPYLKRVEFHKAATNFINNYSVGDALEYVYVEPGNPKAFSVDGVLFTKDNTGKYTFSLYPPSKKDKTFVMPENVELDMFNYYCPYLEELWIPASSRVDSTNALFYRQCFTNLKVIHLQKGHPYEAECKSTLPAEPKCIEEETLCENPRGFVSGTAKSPCELGKYLKNNPESFVENDIKTFWEALIQNPAVPNRTLSTKPISAIAIFTT